MSDSFFEVTEQCLGDAPHFNNAPQWIYELDNPYLHGVYAPTRDEIAADELTVIGKLPEDLCGAYFRNGPNPVFKPNCNYHPFDGDGMVHALYIRDGKASYRNSYISTPALIKEQLEGAAIWPGVMGEFDFSLPDFPIKDTANTDIAFFNGQMLSTWYMAGMPQTMEPLSLKNGGTYHLPGRDKINMSAHAHVDYHSGELLFMDFGDEAPYMTYGVVNPDGSLKKEVAIDLPGPRTPHDFGFSRNYTVLHDMPFFHDPDILQKYKRRVVKFHRDIPTRFGVIPRYGDSCDVRWFECEPCYVLHITNCWEEGDWLIMDGCRSVNPMPKIGADEGILSAMLAYMRLEANNHRWRFNLKTGEVREADIDDLNTEFNNPNPFIAGTKTRYAYHQRIPLVGEGGSTLRFTGLVKYNNDTGQYDQWEYGEGVFGSEAAFAPRAGFNEQSDEDDGYVITFAIDSKNFKSEALIFDAKDITQGPICRVQLPHRVPAGFHSTWVRGEDIYNTQ